jgi:hypothetical protein
MAKWNRKAELLELHNRARKAQRRGDAAETARWFKAIIQLQTVRERHDAALRRTEQRDREEYEWQLKQAELEAGEKKACERRASDAAIVRRDVHSPK